jgi:hypothetical protein
MDLGIGGEVWATMTLPEEDTRSYRVVLREIRSSVSSEDLTMRSNFSPGLITLAISAKKSFS